MCIVATHKAVRCVYFEYEINHSPMLRIYMHEKKRVVGGVFFATHVCVHMQGWHRVCVCVFYFFIRMYVGCAHRVDFSLGGQRFDEVMLIQAL